MICVDYKLWNVLLLSEMCEKSLLIKINFHYKVEKIAKLESYLWVEGARFWLTWENFPFMFVPSWLGLYSEIWFLPN